MSVCEDCGKRHPARCRVSPQPDKQKVANEIAVLERQQFEFADDEDKRDAINEIRELANEQILDDVYSIAGKQRDRIGNRGGGGWVETRDDLEGERGMFRPRTEDEQALGLGMAGFLERLTPDQHVVYRMRYGDQQMTERHIAKILGKSQPAVHQQLDRIHDAIVKMLRETFGGEETP